ncbi:MAG: hypothetical protein WKF30_13510 [Pyrinomonadaceae bacterium]
MITVRTAEKESVNGMKTKIQWSIFVALVTFSLLVALTVYGQVEKDTTKTFWEYKVMQGPVSEAQLNSFGSENWELIEIKIRSSKGDTSQKFIILNVLNTSYRDCWRIQNTSAFLRSLCCEAAHFVGFLQHRRIRQQSRSSLKRACACAGNRFVSSSSDSATLPP